MQVVGKIEYFFYNTAYLRVKHGTVFIYTQAARDVVFQHLRLGLQLVLGDVYKIADDTMTR